MSAMKTKREATCFVEHLPLCEGLCNDLVFLQSNWLFCLAVQSPESERNIVMWLINICHITIVTVTCFWQGCDGHDRQHEYHTPVIFPTFICKGFRKLLFCSTEIYLWYLTCWKGLLFQTFATIFKFTSFWHKWQLILIPFTHYL